MKSFNEKDVLLEAMKEAVRLSGLTQTEIAIRMGDYQSNISRMLSGGFTPSWGRMMRLFKACGVTIKEIHLEKIE